MDVRQLEMLVAIADQGSFSAAARSLFTVQSNVSGHIARLEKELGVILVDRTKGRVTEDGAVVVDRARQILRELDGITAEMSSRGHSVQGTVRIGALGTTARWVLPGLLGLLRRTHPGVHALVHEGNTTNLVPRLVSGHLDAVIIHLPIDEAELDIEPLFTEDLVLLCPATHPLAERDSVTLSELAAHPLILPPAGTALRRVIDKATAAENVILQASAEIDGVRLMASLAIDGFGATIVPATAVPPRLGGPFHHLAVPELPGRVVAWVCKRRPSPGSPVRATREILRQSIAERASEQPGVHIASE